MWHETNSQSDGTIQRNTQFGQVSEDLILSGPHFFTANLFYKTPNRICNKHHEYDSVDLINISNDYLPRTNYTPLAIDYEQRIPLITFGKDEPKKITDYYRLAYRGMLSQSGERTLIGSIIPKEATHTNAVRSILFKDNINLLKQTILSTSIIADFFIKSTGRSNLHYTWETFPLIDINNQMIERILSLSCITTHYTELWEEQFNKKFKSDN